MHKFTGKAPFWSNKQWLKLSGDKWKCAYRNLKTDIALFTKWNHDTPTEKTENIKFNIIYYHNKLIL